MQIRDTMYKNKNTIFAASLYHFEYMVENIYLEDLFTALLYLGCFALYIVMEYQTMMMKFFPMCSR